MLRLLVPVVCLLVAGCLAHVEMEPPLENPDDWLQVVMDHRAAVNASPEDSYARIKLEKVEQSAAEHYLALGNQQLAEGNMDEAIAEYRSGLIARPNGERLKHAMGTALAAKEAQSLYQQAISFIQLDRFNEAEERLEDALDLNPHHDQARERLSYLKNRKANLRERRSVFTSQEKISLSFNNTDVRDVFMYLAEAYKLNVIFDNEISGQPVTIRAEKVTLKQAVDLLLRASKTQIKQIGSNTLLVAPDTEEKRAEYQDRLLRTYSLNTIKAAEMAEILKASLSLDTVVVNEHMNTLSVRETEDMLPLVENLVIANDQPAGEVILDVEVLEVDRTKTEQLGLNLGEQVTLDYPQYTVSDSFRDSVLRKGVVTIPTITFNYLKKDVDATILASPSLRAVDNQEARLHIGERVPLRSSTILDATGQTRTTFEYRDVGIKLEVVPDIHLDGSVTANVKVEVSALGSNVGTPDEPAISILTRHVETGMLLKDGETAVIGGLIQSMEGNNKARPVGLGEIPGLGRLFTNSSDEKRRTDVMLTITPRIVRAQALPPHSVREFYAGSGNRLSASYGLAYMPTNNTIRIGDAYSGQRQQQRSDALPDAPQGKVLAEDSAQPPSGTRLLFTDSKYQTAPGQEVSVVMRAQSLSSIKALPLQFMYNPAMLEFVKAEPLAGGTLSVSESEGQKPGMTSLILSGTPGSASGDLVKITLKGKQAGISYFMSKPAVLETAKGDTLPLDSVMSRVLVN